MQGAYKILDSIKKVNVFNYKDPILFLLDSIENANKMSPNGFDVFVNKLNLSNSRIFFDIIKRRKKITIKHVCFLQNSLELSLAELRYFKLIIKFNNMTSFIEKEFFKQLIENERVRATNDQISSDLIGMWRRVSSHAIGDPEAIPPPFARDDANMYIDEKAGEIVIYTEPVYEDKAWTQFIPYNLNLKTDRVNKFEFDFQEGILPEVDYYTINQVAENITLIDVRWCAEDRWGTWKAQLSLDSSKQNLYANIIIDGSLWGQCSSYCQFSR